MPILPPPTRSFDEQTAALRTGAGARELDDKIIAVRGGDRAAWLAGMVTNDTRALAPGQSAYTAIVHVKGKLLADAWVFVRADEILLVVPDGTVPGLLEHFDKHIIMEDVETVALPDVRVVTVQGPAAAHVVAPGDGRVFAADRLGRGGVDVVIAADGDAAGVLAEIERGRVAVVEEPAWEAARLEAGVPRFGRDFGGDNYVQEANITPRAVSFSKGCYVGQEVVCRLEMRGHVRRQLASLVIDGETPPAPGASVGELGAITSAARSPALGRCVALAMLKWDVAQQTGHALEVEGRAAQIVARPVP